MSGPAVHFFFAVCVRAGQRRENRNLPCWDTETWAYWVKAGRKAFGPSSKALFGDLSLVETMLANGFDGEAIDAELSRIRGHRESQDVRRAQNAVRDAERAKKQSHDMELADAVRKESIRLEARRIAQERADELGLSAPRAARRRLATIGGGE